jgi:hypothetical protein
MDLFFRKITIFRNLERFFIAITATLKSWEISAATVIESNSGGSVPSHLIYTLINFTTTQSPQSRKPTEGHNWFQNQFVEIPGRSIIAASFLQKPVWTSHYWRLGVYDHRLRISPPQIILTPWVPVCRVPHLLKQDQSLNYLLVCRVAYFCLQVEALLGQDALRILGQPHNEGNSYLVSYGKRKDM